MSRPPLTPRECVEFVIRAYKKLRDEGYPFREAIQLVSEQYKVDPHKVEYFVSQS